ncbi:GYD domain-containing protein [Actinomycetospora chiangmaiensis]|uniref:GYD domain-containing protein n=1 Tax=Actinomycetospora chiangmaiensis TaxID=402650 RepID=UPI000A056DED|nr:GYD domain-containing protein [Actinomycetospora chiangmaiensis]
MATFAYFFHYKPESWARMTSNPGDRTEAVARTVREAGGELTALYYTLGELGGLAIAEAPTPEVAAAINLVITGSGAFDRVTVQQLVTAADFVPVLTNAQQAAPGYRKPGS